MDKDDGEITSRRSDSLGRRQLEAGRLGTYTVLGAATGVVPLPWVPSALAKRVRGALVHDITARQGLSLTTEARAVLVDPAGPDGSRGVFVMGLGFAAARLFGRLGPLGAVPPIRSALGTFVLGHLLQRYIETARTLRSVRIDVEEARRVRRAIDQALVYTLTTEANRAGENVPRPPEDLRDNTTQVIDGLLLSVANVPSWLIRRLDAAFDEVISNLRG